MILPFSPHYDRLTTYRQHLACLTVVAANFCDSCNRAAGGEEIYFHHSECGWRHTVCGELLIERSGFPYCERFDCTRFVDASEIHVNDPLSA